jgi:hypothetical protein
MAVIISPREGSSLQKLVVTRSAVEETSCLYEIPCSLPCSQKAAVGTRVLALLIWNQFQNVTVISV